MTEASSLLLPRRNENPEFGSGSIFFVGNATLLIRYAGFTILTDPNFLHAGDHVHLGYGLISVRRTNPALARCLVRREPAHEKVEPEVEERLRIGRERHVGEGGQIREPVGREASPVLAHHLGRLIGAGLAVARPDAIEASRTDASRKRPKLLPKYAAASSAMPEPRRTASIHSTTRSVLGPAGGRPIESRTASLCDSIAR